MSGVRAKSSFLCRADLEGEGEKQPEGLEPLKVGGEHYSRRKREKHVREHRGAPGQRGCFAFCFSPGCS